jgi:hypothetical protein
MAFCRVAGFGRVNLESVVNGRAHVSCFRKWEIAAGGGGAPFINCVENAVSGGQEFSSRGDDYVSIWFKAPYEAIQTAEVFPEIGGFAASPVALRAAGGDGWNVVAKLPPGVCRSLTEVKVRVRDSQPSNVVRIAVDLRAVEPDGGAPPMVSNEPFEIRGVSDGVTWEAYRIRAHPGASVAVWVIGFPAACRASDVIVRLGEDKLPCVFLSELDREGLRQINALLPEDTTRGRHMLSISARNAATPPVFVEVVGDH